MSGKSFVSIENIVAQILMEIGDEANRRYYIRASQWAINEYRRINISRNPFYLERRVVLDSNLLAADYPNKSIQILAVGVYRNGEFWPFTRKPNMALRPVDAEDSIYVENEVDESDINEYGLGFGYRGDNIGYWVDDPENCRFFVKNYRYNVNNGSYSDTTSDIVTKVVVRYKTDGIDCGNDLCIPIEAQALVIQMVYYKFLRKNIPFQVTEAEKNRQERLIDSLTEEYDALQLEPRSLWEVKDALFGSLNTTAHR